MHGAGIPFFGNANVCLNTSTTQNPGGAICPSPDTACTCTNAAPFGECQVFKISNLAAFYLDSIAGKASLYFRDKLLREGLSGPVPDAGLPDGAYPSGPGGVGAASVGINEQSSGIGLEMDGGLLGPAAPDDKYNDSPDASTGPTAPGYWDPVGTVWNPYAAPPTLLRPKPGWLNRLAGFDLVNDSAMPDGTPPPTNNYVTNRTSIADLQGKPHRNERLPRTAHCRSMRQRSQLLRSRCPTAMSPPTGWCTAFAHALTGSGFTSATPTRSSLPRRTAFSTPWRHSRRRSRTTGGKTSSSR